MLRWQLESFRPGHQVCRPSPTWPKVQAGSVTAGRAVHRQKGAGTHHTPQHSSLTVRSLHPTTSAVRSRDTLGQSAVDCNRVLSQQPAAIIATACCLRHTPKSRHLHTSRHGTQQYVCHAATVGLLQTGTGKIPGQCPEDTHQGVLGRSSCSRPCEPALCTPCSAAPCPKPTTAVAQSSAGVQPTADAMFGRSGQRLLLVVGKRPAFRSWMLRQGAQGFGSFTLILPQHQKAPGLCAAAAAATHQVQSRPAQTHRQTHKGA